MLIFPCDCCGPVAVLGCCPVSIPLQDITLTYASTGAAGNGSMTMVYTPAAGFTPATWDSACLDVGTYDITGGSTPLHNWLKFQLSCSTSGTTQIRYSLYRNSACTGTLTGTGLMTIDSFTGSPFHLHHDVILSEGTLYYGGFTTLDYDSTVNAPGACKYMFNVSGCNFQGAEGVSVSAWTSSAKTTLIGSGTTDSNGDLLIVSDQRTTNGHYEITGSRFVTQSGNGLTSSATSTNNFILSEASDYHCNGFCAWPTPDTIHPVHPVFGALTLAYSGGQWTGTKAFSYPGNVAGGGSCAAATVTISFAWDSGAGWSESWLYDGSDCPTDSGGNTATAFWTFDGPACYVPGSTAFSADFELTPSAGPQENLYGTTSTLHFPLTE